MAGIVRYGSYVPYHRLTRAAIGAGKGERAVASYDEDAVSMAVEAARDAVRGGVAVDTLMFATLSPAYAEKLDAATIQAALDLPEAIASLQLTGTSRMGLTALLTGLDLAAAGRRALVCASDLVVGAPGGRARESAAATPPSPSSPGPTTRRSRASSAAHRRRPRSSTCGGCPEDRFRPPVGGALHRRHDGAGDRRHREARSRRRRGRGLQSDERDPGRHQPARHDRTAEGAGTLARADRGYAGGERRSRRRRARGPAAGARARRRQARRPHPGGVGGRRRRRAGARGDARDHRDAAGAEGRPLALRRSATTSRTTRTSSGGACCPSSRRAGPTRSVRRRRRCDGTSAGSWRSSARAARRAGPGTCRRSGSA